MNLEEYKNRFIESLIRGTGYQPEDIVGVAIGTTYPGQGDRVHALYLTDRGVEELKQENLKAIYDMQKEKFGILELCTNMESYAPIVSESIKRMDKKYIDLKCKDGLKRVLVLYTKDKTTRVF